ncbi:ABC transporter permease [Actinoplanes siamensis]|uniref:ABC transporter permease n=1 Tax=Actinoplanes siamensis TaxID=1223317 RepID=A0A919KC26_9ACTN|nr:ABC transporter permease [Actinoplanes siamensis]GIF02830.1 ABC transporter permease [Actinoplanes siamensis]
MTAAEQHARNILGIQPARMQVADWLRESAVSLTRHPGRSLLTTIGTILGAAAFVATLGIGTTIGEQVSNSFDVRRATEVRVSAVDKNDGAADWHGQPRLDRLRALNGVKAAGARVTLGERPLRRTLSSEPSAVQVIGVDAGALSVISPHITIGRTFDSFHESRKTPVVLLPKSVAQNLGITRPGTAVFIGDRGFSVLGIFDDVIRRPETLLAVVVPASTTSTLTTSSDNPEFDVLVATQPGSAQLIGEQAALALLPEAFRRLKVVAPPDPREFRREVEGNVQRLSLSLSLVALIVGAVSIANATTASVASRTAEIGLRRAIGARSIHIFAQLTGESTALGLFGGVIGVAVGLTTVSILSLVLRWSPVIDLRVAAIAALASATFGMAAGLIPAAKATRIQPVAALQQ